MQRLPEFFSPQMLNDYFRVKQASAHHAGNAVGKFLSLSGYDPGGQGDGNFTKKVLPCERAKQHANGEGIGHVSNDRPENGRQQQKEYGGYVQGASSLFSCAAAVRASSRVEKN